MTCSVSGKPLAELELWRIVERRRPRLLKCPKCGRWLASVYPLTFGWAGEKIEALAVVDDDDDADLGDGSFFKTHFEHGGLTEDIGERIIAHLGCA